MPALFIIAAVILLLVAAAVRNALAVVLACGFGLAVWTATHDLPATCAVALTGLFVTSVILQVGGASPSRLVRTITLSAEAITAAAASAMLAFMLFHGDQGPLAMAVTLTSAALIGAAVALGSRAKTH